MFLVRVCSNETLDRKRLKQTWDPSLFAVSLAGTKGQDWSSSCSSSKYVPKGTVMMDHWPEEYQTEDNPLGVGSCFGVSQTDGTDKDGQLDVSWYDGKRVSVKQVLSWECPPVGAKLRVKDPIRGGRQLVIDILGYSSRGVTLYATAVHKKGVKQKPTLPKPRPKRKRTEAVTASCIILMRMQ